MRTKLEHEAKSTLYDQDFYEWTQRSARELRDHTISRDDLELVAQEIEDMGKRDFREMKSRARQLILHLLKWVAQPYHRSRSWQQSIVEQRNELENIFEDSPSLRQQLDTELNSSSRIYSSAIREATAETSLGREAFPGALPWTLEQLLDHGYWPERWAELE
jgi:hypothetical protein